MNHKDWIESYGLFEKTMENQLGVSLFSVCGKSLAVNFLSMLVNVSGLI